MTFYLGEIVLFMALLLTSLQVLRMRSELKRMRAYHAEFNRVFDQTETALTAIQATVRDLHASGRAVVDELGQRIDTARLLLGELSTACAEISPARRAAEAGAPAVSTSRSAA